MRLERQNALFSIKQIAIWNTERAVKARRETISHLLYIQLDRDICHLIMQLPEASAWLLTMPTQTDADQKAWVRHDKLVGMALRASLDQCSSVCLSRSSKRHT
jgi:hypothetical protein